MELKIYLRVLLKYWWIILPIFLFTLAVTLFFTLRQTPVYASTITYVLTPSDSYPDVRAYIDGLYTISSRIEIASTYGQISSSRTIREAALKRANLPPEKQHDITIKGELLTGTNIFKITVEAPDPEIARDMATAVGEETVEYVGVLYEAFEMRQLDAATVLRQPVRPSVVTSALFGGLFGLILGAGVAFLADYLRTPMETLTSVNVLDQEVGVYSEGYFVERLRVEMARSKRQGYPLSVALFNIDQMGLIRRNHSSQAKSEILRKAAVFLRQQLREEDLVAYLGDAIFGLLLADMTEEMAQSAMERLRTRVSWTPFELERTGVKVNVTSAVGISSFDFDDTRADELLDRARQAMQAARVYQYGEAYLAAQNVVKSEEQPVES